MCHFQIDEIDKILELKNCWTLWILGFSQLKNKTQKLKFGNNFFRSLYKNMNLNFNTWCRCHRIKENLKPFGGSSQETVMLQCSSDISEPVYAYEYMHIRVFIYTHARIQYIRVCLISMYELTYWFFFC